MSFDAKSLEEWQSLDIYAATRYRELSKTFEPLVEAINDYEKLACRMVLALGEVKSLNNNDDALLDLFGEAFDSLHSSKRQILEWLPSSNYALLRRAYEVTSLLAYFVFNPTEIDKWEKGKQITNKEIREFLAKQPMGDPIEILKRHYSALSEGTHVNRVSVPRRYLGKGNEFTLGSIGRPHLTIVAEHLFWLAGVWFWLMAVTTYKYKEALDLVDPKFGKGYMTVAENIQVVVKAIQDQWGKLAEFDVSDDNA